MKTPKQTKQSAKNSKEQSLIASFTDIRRLIAEDEDFIYYPEFENSIEKLLRSYPDGVPDNVICRVLGISNKTLTLKYNKAVETLRHKIG